VNIIQSLVIHEFLEDQVDMGSEHIKLIDSHHDLVNLLTLTQCN